MSDRDYSPFGNPLWFTIRRGVWIRADPWYGEHKPEEARNLRVRRFWFPHLGFDFKLFHGYIGWKPIAVPRIDYRGEVPIPIDGDHKFYWWPLVDLEPGELAVQWSHRFGIGARR